MFHDKVRVIFDGVDTAVWKPLPRTPRTLGNLTFSEGTRIVTYATRGMESLRGFDIFMRAAKQLYLRRRDVVFVVAGQDRICYGGDAEFTGGRTFKEWVLAQDQYDISRFAFVGLLPPAQLAQLFALSDLHIYLTAPFVLSWSLINALACGTTVLASDTAPVREMITHGQNGLLVDFFDVDGLSDMANRVLDDPAQYRPLGEAGIAQVHERYSLDVCLPQMWNLYQEVLANRGKTGHGSDL
jgi:glycosyltransferase involved in cell wall biosynthesis